MITSEEILSHKNFESFFHSVDATGAYSAPDSFLEKPFDKEKTDNEILLQVVGYYHKTLKNTPKILGAIQNIGINKSEAIDYFKLGFSGRTLGNLLPEKNRKEGAAIRGRLQRLGILKSSGHELFRGSLVVPIIENGIVKQIYGHKISKKLRPGAVVDTYMSDTSHGFFNLKAVQTCDEVVMCSSILEVLTFWCAGYKNATCRYSMEALYEH